MRCSDRPDKDLMTAVISENIIHFFDVRDRETIRNKNLDRTCESSAMDSPCSFF